MGMRQIKIKQSITVRESLSLEAYLRQIDKIPLLSLEEEEALAKQIQASLKYSVEGDVEAINALAKGNLRFAVSIAKQYQNKGMNLNDLINEGNLGLIKAAQRFDPTKRFKFISYAVWWIRQSILEALADNTRAVRLHSNRVVISHKINVESGEFIMKHEREPTNEELAALIQVQPHEIAELGAYLFPSLSLSSPIQKPGTDSEGVLEDILISDTPKPDHALSHDESLRIGFKQVISLLNKPQQEVITGLFGLNGTEKTLDDLAKELGLTKERIRQIKDRAISRLSTQKVRKILASY